MTKSNEIYKKLKREWQALYTQYHFHPSLQKEQSKTHYTFNYLLKDYLYEAQLKDFLPSVKYLETKCAELWRRAEREKNSGLIDPDRLDQARIKQTVLEGQFLPVTTDHDESGEKLPYPYLKGRLIMTVGYLSQTEMQVLEEALGASYDENFDALNLLAISVPITKPLSDETELKISDYCKRIALLSIRDYVSSHKLGVFEFEYSLKQKLKDYILDRSI
ncbi:hypothetical protein [Vibrio owensii]|uniref:hypothetical protein n=1 Tax=Vibrio harveyi group TaxID=717610 RepID=UPI003CC530BD